MSQVKGDNPVTIFFAILFIFTTIIGHGETSYFSSASAVSRDTTEVIPNTASKMTLTTQNETVNVAKIAQKSNGNTAALALQYLEKKSTAVPKTTAERTTALPTTIPKKTTVLATSLKRTTAAPKTTLKETTVAPTTVAKRTTAAATTTAKQTTAMPKTTTTKKTTSVPTTPVPTTTAKRTTAVPKTTANTKAAPTTSAKKTTATKTTKEPPPDPYNFFNFTSNNEVCILENITAAFTTFDYSSKNESVVQMSNAFIDKRNSHCGNSKPGNYSDAVLTVRWMSSNGGKNSFRQTYSVDGRYYYLKSYKWTLVTKKNGTIIAANSIGNNDTFRTMFGRSLTCGKETVLMYHGKNYNVTLALSKVQLQAFDISTGDFSESYECGTNPSDKTSVIIYIVIAVVTCIIVIAAIAIAFCIYQQKTAHSRAGYESV